MAISSEIAFINITGNISADHRNRGETMGLKANANNRESNRAALENLMQEALRHASGGQVRVISPMVSGKDITLAHVIGTSDYSVYKNLGLDIGFHEGEDPTGRSIGILHIHPAESVVISADIAVKWGDIDIGFMDRFSGSLIITGPRAEVDSAIRENCRYFRDELDYTVCPISHE